MSIVKAINELSGKEATTIEKAIKNLEIGGSAPKELIGKDIDAPVFTGTLTRSAGDQAEVATLDETKFSQTPERMYCIINGEKYTFSRAFGPSDQDQPWLAHVWFGDFDDGNNPVFDTYPISICYITNGQDRTSSYVVYCAEGVYSAEIGYVYKGFDLPGIKTACINAGFFPILITGEPKTVENRQLMEFTCSCTYDDLIYLVKNNTQSTNFFQPLLITLKSSGVFVNETRVYTDVSVYTSYNSYMQEDHVHILTKFSHDFDTMGAGNFYLRDFSMRPDGKITFDAKWYKCTVTSQTVSWDFM